MSKIVIIGSSNMDLVVKADHIPQKGETIITGDASNAFGGKGANQAIAAQRLGGDVSFITKIGLDSYGDQMYSHFVNEGLPKEYIIRDKTVQSGVAWICVDKKGENSIIVIPGANNRLSVDDICAYKELISSAQFLLLQLEIPMETVEYVADYAHSRGVKVILNPAPATILSKELLSKLYLITPNENECKLLCQDKATDSCSENAQTLLDMGVANVIVTLGSRGSMLKTEGKELIVPTKKVKSVDTTGAGDTYNGALCLALSKGKTLIEAMEYATQAAAISVTRFGAQPSIPYASELELL